MPELDRDGVKIHYEVHGSGGERTPLLLSHGYSASSAMWEPNLGVLAADRAVITWDIRGHGLSGSPRDQRLYSQELSIGDMAAVLDAAGVGRAAIGGLSLGGYLSLAFNVAHRERVAALLLFDTGPGYKRAEPRQAWNDFAEQTAVAFEAKGLASLPDSPEARLGAHDPAGLALAARGILAQHDATVMESLPSIDVPTLVLVGADDEQFLAATDILAAKVPGAEKVVLPDAGHAANLDQPEAFNRAVTEFLDRL